MSGPRRPPPRGQPDACSSSTRAANFVAAARQGLAAHLTWLDGEEQPARRADPRRAAAARRRGAGRRPASTDADRERYLGVIERRVRDRHTGSRWLLVLARTR